MAYIGQPPFQEFTNPPTKDSFTGDGSTTTFDLAAEVPSSAENALEVYVNNVRQEPGTGKAFTLGVDGSGDLKRITFTAAPASGAPIYVINDKTNTSVTAPLDFDTNGTELILDGDGDTSLHASTDDQIDIKIAGADDFTFTANTFTAVSGSTIAAQALTATTIGATGVVTANAGVVVDNITIDGTEIDLSSGDLTVDVAGDIVLDADGGDIFFKDAGTTFGSATNTSGNLIIKSGTTTAATFSGANVTLAGTVGSGAITSTGIVTGTGFTAGSAVLAEAELELLDGLTAGTAIASKVVTTDANIDTTGQRNLTISGELDAATGDFSGAVDVAGAFTTGSTIVSTGVVTANAGVVVDTITIDSGEIDQSSGDLTLDSAGDIVLDAGGADVTLKAGGTQYGQFTNTSGNLIIQSGTTTAATFSGANVTFAGTIGSGAITSTGIVTGTAFTAGSAVLAEAELELLDGLTAGTAIASKVVTTDANIDSTGMRNLTISGELDAATLDISGNADIDGTLETDALSIASTTVTATAAEINLIDGGATVGTTAIADGDGVLINDAGTMRVSTVQTLAAYLDDEITAMPNLITIGAAATATTLAGIPFYRNDTSYYTHDVSGTDNAAEYNTAFGFTALDAITTGDKNVAIGYQALTAAQTTQDSVVIGVQAGAALTGGSTNIIIGVNALDTATTCDHNIAIGAHALGGSLDGATKNVCIGRYTGESITTGDNNTFVGYDAGSDQTTAGGNTFIGYKCGHGVATGGSNNAVGSDSLASLTSGYYNNALGSSSLYACTEGINNIAIGHDAGYDTTTGDHNTYIGYKAKASGVNVDNEIVIGHGVHTTSMAGGGTGTIKMGMHNNNINNTFTSNANWSHSSDERWKKNIADNPIGLDFINDLRTVTYNWRAFSEIDPSLSEYNAEDTKYPHPGIQHGMIAQEVRTAMDKHGIEEFGGWYEDKLHEDKQQGISESMYVIPLIKAVQELSEKVKDLELKLEDK